MIFFQLTRTRDINMKKNYGEKKRFNKKIHIKECF